DWPQFHDFLFQLNGTPLVQLTYAHRYTCVNGQILGVTLNSLSRLIIIDSQTRPSLQMLENLSTVKVALIHCTPPILFGAYVFLGQTHSHFELIHSLNRIARITDVQYVQINSVVTFITSFSGACISSMCYILILLTLRRGSLHLRNTEFSLLITSFVLFLCLCALSAFYFTNGLLSFINLDDMYVLRMHYYCVSIPISLLNPWCLLLTSSKL
ncbi:hypothetical protein PENTCL1PPCAC_14581, partial [Pristionchus entomophagus]